MYSYKAYFLPYIRSLLRYIVFLLIDSLLVQEDRQGRHLLLNLPLHEALEWQYRCPTFESYDYDEYKL